MAMGKELCSSKSKTKTLHISSQPSYHPTPNPFKMQEFPHSLLFVPCVPALIPNPQEEEHRKEAPSLVFHGR